MNNKRREDKDWEGGLYGVNRKTRNKQRRREEVHRKHTPKTTATKQHSFYYYHGTWLIPPLTGHHSISISLLHSIITINQTLI